MTRTYIVPSAVSGPVIRTSQLCDACGHFARTEPTIVGFEVLDMCNGCNTRIVLQPVTLVVR